MNPSALSVFALVAATALVACAPAAGTAQATARPLAARIPVAPAVKDVAASRVPVKAATQATVAGPLVAVAPSSVSKNSPVPVQTIDAGDSPGGAFGSDTSAPDPTAVPTATPEPVATATGVPYVAPDDPPQIVTFWISASTVHPGDVLSGGVTASSNVASVEVRVAGYSYLMEKTAPGRFELSATVPSVPKIFRRTYPLVAIARNTRGDATQRSTQITIR